MSERRKKNKREIIVFGILLASILICTAVFFLYIHNFNKAERTFSKGMTEDLEFEIHPRGATTDAWTKWIGDDDGTQKLYKALIYDVILTNKTDCRISSWELKYMINKGCYINNAWCGKIEFHQSSGEEPIVQTLDMRNFDVRDVKLKHKVVETDMLISLEPGDYFIYKPDKATKEFPIEASDLSNEKYQKSTMGIIFYYLSEGTIESADYVITYYLEKQFAKEPAFWCIVTAASLWVIAVVIFVVTEISINSVYKRFKRDEMIVKQALNVFTTFFDAKDKYTNGHSQRVAVYARKLAQKMKFSEEECQKIYYIAMMHDCGKCYIPDSILKKPAVLTKDEYEIIKTHTTKGAEMLKNFDAVENIREGALYHHERYDGSGYPSGKKGEDIPLIGRIICVADAFDAMTSKRCYRDRLSNEKIISEFEENKGKQFDPYIADCMLELIKQGGVQIEPQPDMEEK